MADRSTVDLHLHSSVSDGTDTPIELVSAAADAGITTMALVDHDILDGVPEAASAAAEAGIDFIPGTELSVDHNGVKIHMLVYFLSPGAGPLQDRLAWLRTGRNNRNQLIVDRLNELGYEITIEDVHRHAGGASVGRPQIASALVETGQVVGYNEAFDDLLGDGGLAYVERDRLTAVEAIELARASGAVPVVAHPKTIPLGADEYTTLFSALVDVGLGGIEAHHSSHHPDLRAHLTDLAMSYGIAATGGSDYHGTRKPDIHIGTGTGDLDVPHTALTQLHTQRTQ